MSNGSTNWPFPAWKDGAIVQPTKKELRELEELHKETKPEDEEALL